MNAEAPTSGEPDQGHEALPTPSYAEANTAALSPATTAPAPSADAGQAPPARATPATVTALSAAIAQQAGQRVTRFEVALNPAGLGRVDVSLQIGAEGRLTASLSFHRPDAAADLKARAPELESALKEAGFDVRAADLRFATIEAGVSGDGAGGSLAGQFAEARSEARPSPGARAFSSAADLVDTDLPQAARAARGLDIQV